MTTSVILPNPGMGIDEATVIRWYKAVGEQVQEGEPIAEVETAKALVDVESPATGTLVEILLAEGETAPVNAEIARIEENG